MIYLELEGSTGARDNPLLIHIPLAIVGDRYADQRATALAILGDRYVCSAARRVPKRTEAEQVESHKSDVAATFARVVRERIGETKSVIYTGTDA